MKCKNCQGGCIHSKSKPITHKVELKDKGETWMIGNEFDGYELYCDKNPDGYKKWHEEHKHDTCYEDSVMECYELNEDMKKLNEMVELTKDILKKIKTKKK